jgi:hypothetical protein
LAGLAGLSVGRLAEVNDGGNHGDPATPRSRLRGKQ